MSGTGLLRHGAVFFATLNVGVMVACGFGLAAGNGSVGSVFYVSVLAVLCSVPLLWMRSFNDRYGLLAVFMGCYFLLFGALSLQKLLLGSDALDISVADEFISPARFAALLGAALVLAGYRAGVAMVPPTAAPGTSGAVTGADWSNFAILGVGVFCWVFGSLSFAYYAIVVTPENSMRATEAGLRNMGPLLTFAVMLGYLVQPLGVVMLAYGYAKNRTRLWLVLVIVMMLLQLFLGFITDTKETAALGILLVAMTQTLWDDRIPKGWGISVIAFVILVFPVLQAARVERGEYGLDRAQAFERIPDLLALAWEFRQKADSGARVEHRTQTLLERASTEETVKPIFEHVGVDLPYLHGSTLVALPFAFIPRLLIPDKEDVPVGQLYNHVIMKAPSDDFTYISFSQLGEMYWNFGWPGVIVGMLFTGLILGYAGARSSLAEVRSITRLLIILISIKTLCFGFERGIATCYVVWMRGIAAIALLHWMFARSAVSSAPATAAVEAGAGSPGIGVPVPLFPNIMR